MRRPAPGDRIGLTKITLEVHVDIGRAELLLDRDQVDGELHVAESVLELQIGNIRATLDVHLDGLLDIDNLTFVNGCHHQLPSTLTGQVWDMRTIDLAGLELLIWVFSRMKPGKTHLSTLDNVMSLLLAVLADGRGLGWTIRCTVALLLAKAASASKLTGSSRIGALGLGVTGRGAVSKCPPRRPES